jgi:hypothetical protein
MRGRKSGSTEQVQGLTLPQACWHEAGIAKKESALRLLDKHDKQKICRIG